MSILWWTSSSFVASVVEGKRLVIVSSAGMLFKYADASDKSLLCKNFRSGNRFSCFMFGGRYWAYLEMVI